MAAARRPFSVATALTAAAAGVAFLLYGPGRLNNDSMWSLAWGRQLLHGTLPDFRIGPTPHPLPNAVGVLLAPLGAAAEPVVVVLGFLFAGVLVFATGLVAFRAFGLPTAIGAAAVVLTLPGMVSSTLGAYVDVPYAALVLTAVALEVQRPRRGAATLAVLALAGLVRPEAWVLSGAYWLWMAPTLRERGSWVACTALAAVGPVVWVGADLITTGAPLFSFTHTRDATAASGQRSGTSAIAHLPRFTSQNVGKLVCLAALVGFVDIGRNRFSRQLFGWLVAVTAASALPVLGGTPLNDRYFLATFALLCVFAARGAIGWLDWSGWRKVAGIGCCGLLVVQASINVGSVLDTRNIFGEGTDTRDAAKAALTDGPIRCRPLVVPAQRVRMLAAVWTRIPLQQIRDAHVYRAGGTYLTGTTAAMRGVATLAGRAGTAARPPDGTTLVRSSGGWQLRERC
jgi:hypothetical protein